MTGPIYLIVSLLYLACQKNTLFVLTDLSCWCTVISLTLPNNICLMRTKLKVFEDDILDIAQMKMFLLLPQYF